MWSLRPHLVFRQYRRFFRATCGGVGPRPANEEWGLTPLIMTWGSQGFTPCPNGLAKKLIFQPVQPLPPRGRIIICWLESVIIVVLMLQLSAEQKTQQMRKVYLNNKDERLVKSSVKHIHSLVLKSNYLFGLVASSYYRRPWIFVHLWLYTVKRYILDETQAFCFHFTEFGPSPLLLTACIGSLQPLSREKKDEERGKEGGYQREDLVILEY
jgi:hypothetical protein